MERVGKYNNGIEISYKVLENGVVSYEASNNSFKLYDKQLSLAELYMLKCLYEKVISNNYNEVIENEVKFIKED